VGSDDGREGDDIMIPNEEAAMGKAVVVLMSRIHDVIVQAGCH